MHQGGKLSFRSRVQDLEDDPGDRLVQGGKNPPTLAELVPAGFADVEIEIGPGKGAFVLAATEAKPDTFLLGIEAARQCVMNEIQKVLDNQGIDIDVRHIMLAADTMTASGEVLGINRYGIVKEKPSVLARASFETPLKHIFNAAIVGEGDSLNSVIENVMINQPVPLGTGLPKLVMKQLGKKKSKKE